jgi:hypothetical protein
MASSLDDLSSNLRNGCKSIDDMRKVFVNTSEHFKNDEEFELMTKKGIYPYDYITSFDKLNERRLPYRKDFYSKLSNKECSEGDYNNAIKVWLKFKCKTLLDYHNIYLISDVLLLSDIWENFRNVCYKNYGLDCEYYYSKNCEPYFNSILEFARTKTPISTPIKECGDFTPFSKSSYESSYYE